MKSLLILSFLLFCLPSFADEEVGLAVLGSTELPKGEFTISPPQEMTLNGLKVYNFDLKKVPVEGEICEPKGAVNLNRALVAANLASSIAAGIAVVKLDVDKDKERHALVGYIVGNLTTGAFQLILPKTMKHRKLAAFALGLLGSAGAGAWGEYKDSKGHGRVEFLDFAATVGGGLIGSATFSGADAKTAVKKVICVFKRSNT